MSFGARHPRRGFTLFQLLVLLALLAMLLTLLPPAVAKARQAAGRAECAKNLHQLGVAMINRAGLYQGRMPPMIGGTGEPVMQFGTLHFHLLPYLELDKLFKSSRVKEDGPWVVWGNGVNAKPVRVFVCPDDASAPPGNVFENRLATTSYAANFLAFGATGDRVSYEPVSLQGEALFPGSFTDGTSCTIIFTERYQVCNGVPTGWGYYGANYSAPMFAYYSKSRFQLTPTAADCNPALPQSPHPAGIQVCLADSGVRTVSDKISVQTWWAACTPSGGEILGADW